MEPPRLTERQLMQLALQASLREAEAGSGGGAAKENTAEDADGVANEAGEQAREPRRASRAAPQQPDRPTEPAKAQRDKAEKERCKDAAAFVAGALGAPASTWGRPPQYAAWASDKQRDWNRLLPADPNAYYEKVRACARSQRFCGPKNLKLGREKQRPAAPRRAAPCAEFAKLLLGLALGLGLGLLAHLLDGLL